VPRFPINLLTRMFGPSRSRCLERLTIGSSAGGFWPMERFIKSTDTFKELMFWYFGTVVSCALLFSFFEHKPIDDALWWAFVTALTVGYGDIYPVTPGGRIVAVVLMHSVVLIVAPIIIGRLLNKIMTDAHQFTNDEQEQIKKDLLEIKALLAHERETIKSSRS
jgi:voltage-gated potassium channel